MANSFDQYLASRLTSLHVLWVVLDPASADAVITEAIDEPFWTWVQHAYPPAPVTPSAATATAAPAADAGRLTAPARNPVTGTGHRGTVFLVDPRRRLVLWSAWELPKDSSPVESDRSATRVTNQLKAAFGKK
jgi:hypothetical protein